MLEKENDETDIREIEVDTNEDTGANQASGKAGEVVVETGSSQEDDQFTKAESATQKRRDRLTKKMRTAEREREEALR